MQNNTLKTAALAALIGLHMPTALYAELNTALPGEQEEGFAVPLNLDMPAQPLAAALRQFAIQSNLSLTVDSALIVDKKSPAIKGRITRKEAIKRMLEGTGLQGMIDGEKILIKRVNKAEAKDIQLDKVEVRAKRFYEVGPLPGLGLTKEEIPGNVQSISAQEIKEAHSLSITDLMNRKLQSVSVNDYQGNPFQMDVQYRGFTAGPQIGTPQGLSVFIDGIRVNEPFGDVVNWDMIPMNALASVDVFPGSNPIFGLNTLGGAFTLKTKDGFNNEGIDAQVLTGSFGRKQLQLEGGVNNGKFALFGAGNFFLEDGWRENSPSKVNQFFGKASYRGDKLDLNLSTLLVGNDLVGNGLIPSEMYRQDRNSVFTSPDETKNRLQQFQLSGSYFVNDNFTVTGQIYRRNSNRRQKGGDAFLEGFNGQTLNDALKKPGSNYQYTCLFRSSPAGAYGPGSAANAYGLPDYIVIPVVGYDPAIDPATGLPVNDFINTPIYDEMVNSNTFDPANYSGLINQPLPKEFLAGYEYDYTIFRNFAENESFKRNKSGPPPFITDPDPTFFNESRFRSQFSSALFGALLDGTNGVLYSESEYFFTQDPVSGVITKNYVMLLDAINTTECADGQGTQTADLNILDPITGLPRSIDGVNDGGPGYAEGTPTAILTDNQIDQLTDGASIQLNWNFEKHKFMVGASIDAASAEYTNTQQLGFLTADREAYLDPDQAHPRFAAALVPLSNNNFEGTNATKSVYFSETWKPVDTLSLSLSGRYNETQTKNKIATRSGFFNFGPGDLRAEPDKYNTCTDVDGNGVVNAADCVGIPLGYRTPRLNDVLDPAETEKFSFYSFNPSLGATWQAKENLNLFASLSQGTRTPSVIELGCAFDKTPTPDLAGTIRPRSLAQNRECRLPSALSGDPFLPQIRATTYDIGMRGNFSDTFGADSIQWNLGAYQTDLKDDIYFVAVGNGQGFFDSIGKTRRRGLEAGLSGKKDRWSFGLNYGLTDATFEDTFKLISIDNSSSVDTGDGFGPSITVNKGNRMPGTALHNLNASLSYDVTDKWRVGMTAIAHSESFVRGNENNEHKAGVRRLQQVVATTPNAVIDPVTGLAFISLPPTTNPGKVPGYMTFNFQTSYKFNKEWTATMIINNIFDKEYFSAGRLGRNPFSPSINGAIGVSGYNHNSGDWLSTNYIAPGAPRGIWFSLNWLFVPD
ncbi:TonB-dependent receptor domain-containing protein [Methylophilus medardicus]|uniref:TonB-dependent receptor n=1 Tax=Methylophilus medardicus TaxID=2588534 RepID=A0A5B8CQR0_9PROT|nr:TonB-dependent receptor [Methylophilus medardicus]QDC43582.1 TonB-dependent receptor [Methylophilus medardicus]QDC48589.1 TonB-dependent receptor [Methylophilus medardicus]QDC52294.1 TonB-dependent receptor [Methylophilus medardicus]